MKMLSKLANQQLWQWQTVWQWSQIATVKQYIGHIVIMAGQCYELKVCVCVCVCGGGGGGGGELFREF